MSATEAMTWTEPVRVVIDQLGDGFDALWAVVHTGQLAALQLAMHAPARRGGWRCRGRSPPSPCTTPPKPTSPHAIAARQRESPKAGEFWPGTATASTPQGCHGSTRPSNWRGFARSPQATPVSAATPTPFAPCSPASMTRRYQTGPCCRRCYRLRQPTRRRPLDRRRPPQPRRHRRALHPRPRPHRRPSHQRPRVGHREAPRPAHPHTTRDVSRRSTRASRRVNRSGCRSPGGARTRHVRALAGSPRTSAVVELVPDYRWSVVPAAMPRVGGCPAFRGLRVGARRVRRRRRPLRPARCRAAGGVRGSAGAPRRRRASRRRAQGP